MTTEKTPTAKIMLGTVRSAPWRYAINLAIWIAIWTLPIIPALITRTFFDQLEVGVGANVPTLVAIILAYGAARIVIMATGMWNDINFEYRSGSLLRRNMLERIYEVPSAQVAEGPPGETISRFREDVEQSQETIAWTADMVGSLSFALAAVWILGRIDAGLTAAVFVPLVLIVLVAERFGGRVKRYREQARVATGKITASIGEMFGAVQSIKVAGAEDSMMANLRQLNEERRTAMVRDRVLTALLESVFWNAISIGIGAILLLGAGSLASENGLTIGEFALFVYFLGFATEAGFFVGIFIARFKQSTVSYARIHEFMGGPSALDMVEQRDLNLKGPLRAIHTPTPVGADRLRRLEVRNLAFTYPGTSNGISGIEFDVQRGDFIVITGRIGSGKTTLIRALLGLVDSSGTVVWNGNEVTDLASWMVPPHAAYTPQVPNLFSMALRDNLQLGRDDSDEALDTAISTAALDEDVAAMPQGLATMVGPRGMRLSGGQIQRAAAARMLVRRPDLLAFDDLSSALDVETEQTLWQRLFETQGDATTLVVSHRRPALLRATQILVMEGGEIVGRGTYSQLLESSDAFRQLWTGENLAGHQ